SSSWRARRGLLKARIWYSVSSLNIALRELRTSSSSSTSAIVAVWSVVFIRNSWIILRYSGLQGKGTIGILADVSCPGSIRELLQSFSVSEACGIPIRFSLAKTETKEGEVLQSLSPQATAPLT